MCSCRVLDSTSSGKVEVMHSRFEATAAPARTPEEALQAVETVRRNHPKANHVAFAYALLSGDRRCSDDGEPSGTAGAPILSMLDAENTRDACVAVARHFGGKKLGRGGLVRAYGAAARMALEQASTRLYEEHEDVLLRISPATAAFLHHVAALHGATSDPSQDVYDAEGQVTTRMQVQKDRVEAFLAKLKDVTRGDVIILQPTDGNT
eukprot:CAMPEP_0183828608 /NCGR_PEP_ID=MMETSP0807_2-20130328/2876_1 /TAXON_ID=88271 /ORGANISM="Picocystis salinarum, Strain CCMP1897" /LENGTH=207 /DNA_ID=CAMNT_0026073805 /DNA_START=12 /DNA_END=635 /DNA_ORIENTATION=+